MQAQHQRILRMRSGSDAGISSQVIKCHPKGKDILGVAMDLFEEWLWNYLRNGYEPIWGMAEVKAMVSILVVAKQGSAIYI